MKFVTRRNRKRISRLNTLRNRYCFPVHYIHKEVNPPTDYLSSTLLVSEKLNPYIVANVVADIKTWNSNLAYDFDEERRVIIRNGLLLSTFVTVRGVKLEKNNEYFSACMCNS